MENVEINNWWDVCSWWSCTEGYKHFVQNRADAIPGKEFLAAHVLEGGGGVILQSAQL